MDAQKTIKKYILPKTMSTISIILVVLALVCAVMGIAAMGGAEHVTAVDVSADAVKMAEENVRRNGLDERMDCICENVFDLLPRLEQEGKKPRRRPNYRRYRKNKPSSEG